MNQETNRWAPSKVPEVTIGFWVIKIIATTLGEVGGNAVSMSLNFGYLMGSVLFGVPLVASIWAQIRANGFLPSLYWLTITLTTLAGTTLADFSTRSLGIGYAGGSLVLLALVVISLVVWKRTLGSVDIKTVTTPRSEKFYWATIMFSQTLGTALGDWMADKTGLGYNGSALLITGVLVALVALAVYSRTSRTALFWTAFVLTRPLGATLANSLDKPVSRGGLGMSDLVLTAALSVLLILGVLFIPQKAGRH